jgi:hypothetical protein
MHHLEAQPHPERARGAQPTVGNRPVQAEGQEHDEGDEAEPGGGPENGGRARHLRRHPNGARENGHHQRKRSESLGGGRLQVRGERPAETRVGKRGAENARSRRGFGRAHETRPAIARPRTRA